MIVDAWNGFLMRIPEERRDLYFSESYSRLYEDRTHRATAFVYVARGETFVFPMLLSPIPDRAGLYDFETPYGYGGPASSSDDPRFLRDAFTLLKEEARFMGIVAGLVRFHPLLGNADLAAASIPVFKDRETVYMDLEPEESIIWAEQIHSKNRNVIRKAIDQGMEFAVDAGFERIEDFMNLYNGTMKRLEADEFYFFDDRYFRRIAEAFTGKSFLAHVLKNGKPVSSAIILHDGSMGHYHLSGSDPEWLRASPNNLLLYRAALTLKAFGVRRFHLGGGTTSDPADSLLAFKKRFSRHAALFSIGKPVFMAAEYRDICAAWETANPEKTTRYGNRVLKYRF